ncbi:MAG TPA: class I SAM-dependent methyltransferase [Pyrinomonadaceae bacterium]|jgi:SAM-dependent methyltransferase|nr:class I SAM-dependent methyltransferase [Pyrinomonadaceae bacterium]
MSPSNIKDLYRRAGIEDVAEFYRTRYVSDELLDARYFDALNRFDIRWTRTLWVYENVRRGSSVLDLGCGGGLLALLKRKEVTLTGVDISADCALISRRNGYDRACVARLTALPFLDQSFDYVVSLDVMGHIEFAEKDAVLAEIKRVLRPDGVTLHGIECLDREKRKDYDQMSEEELRRYIGVDGHVGMEDQGEIAARFNGFFQEVRCAPRYGICQSHDEFLKQADEYGTPLCDADFLDYLREMNFAERRAFNMAMGYVFDTISEYDIRLPKSEYLLVKASAAPLGDFYKEHREEHGWLSIRSENSSSNSVCLDRASSTPARALFDGGWYEAELFPPVARWMGERARIRFTANSLSQLRFDLTTHIPDLHERPLGLEFFLRGQQVLAVSLIRPGWLEIVIDILDQSKPCGAAGDNLYEFEIRADRTWQPRPLDERNRDDRELSIAVCNIEIFP